jgi:hypothetical protein
MGGSEHRLKDPGRSLQATGSRGQGSLPDARVTRGPASRRPSFLWKAGKHGPLFSKHLGQIRALRAAI